MLGGSFLSVLSKSSLTKAFSDSSGRADGYLRLIRGGAVVGFLFELLLPLRRPDEGPTDTMTLPEAPEGSEDAVLMLSQLQPFVE
jgi:hypothetical protein